MHGYLVITPRISFRISGAFLQLYHMLRALRLLRIYMPQSGFFFDFMLPEKGLHNSLSHVSSNQILCNPSPFSVFLSIGKML